MQSTFDNLRELIERELAAALPLSRLDRAGKLNESLQTAVFPGGKRIRPLLTLLSARLAGASWHCAIPAACGIEFLHTSSLIFDDLPAMDDAYIRRGRPALHLIYGESCALLAALALFNQAYKLFGSCPRLMEEAVACIGSDGMIGGQAVDTGGTCNSQAAFPFAARNRKTSGLMRLTFTAGAILCNASPEEIESLAHAGECLGEAYQVCDDLLDQQSKCEVTGKTAMQDTRHVRPSHARDFGLTTSMVHVSGLLNTVTETLERSFGTARKTNELLTFIDAIVQDFRFAAVSSA